MKVLVFVEQRGGKLKQSAFEALTIGAKLAGSNADLAAVIVGKGIGALAGQLAGYGADTVFVADQDGMENYNVIQYAAAVQEAVKGFGANCLLGIASPMGRDLFPRLAARLDAGILTDLTQVEAKGGFLTGTKPMYSGKCLAKVAIKSGAMQLATLRPNVFPATKTGQGGGGPSANRPLRHSRSRSTFARHSVPLDRPRPSRTDRVRSLPREPTIRLQYQFLPLGGPRVAFHRGGLSRAASQRPAV